MGNRKAKSGGTPSRKQQGEWGAHPGGKPRSIAWRTDYDYLSKLDPATRLWLAEFSDRYYGADFRGDTKGEWSKAERRETYRAKNAANRDAYTSAQVDQLEYEVEPPDAPEVSPEATPEYLNAPEYKAAVERMREAIPTGRRKHPKKPSPRLRAAQSAVRAVTPIEEPEVP